MEWIYHILFMHLPVDGHMDFPTYSLLLIMLLWTFMYKFLCVSVLGAHWKDWCWGWNSNILATSYEGLTHWKRPWCWEGLGPGGEGDDRGWDGWMASPTWWTWIWVNSRSWWWTGRPGLLRFMGSQRVGHDWTTKLNWTDALYLLGLCWICRQLWVVYRNNIKFSKYEQRRDVFPFV